MRKKVEEIQAVYDFFAWLPPAPLNRAFQRYAEGRIRTLVSSERECAALMSLLRRLAPGWLSKQSVSQLYAEFPDVFGHRWEDANGEVRSFRDVVVAAAMGEFRIARSNPVAFAFAEQQGWWNARPLPVKDSDEAPPVPW
jgi:hypothetical protein